MSRNTPFIIVFFTIAWIIFAENLSLATAVTGMVVSIGVLIICHKLLPMPHIASNIKLFRFALYPFYLLGQIYIAAFNAIKLIFSDVDVAIVKVRTKISNNLLRAVLANSFTLTPGTISLDVEGDDIAVLWLKKKTVTYQEAQEAGEATKNKLEKILLKTERKQA